MKKYVTIILVVFAIQIGFSQPLTGIKTIKSSGGDYSNFTDAISALNSNGVGTGGVIFNVDANFVDSASNLVITDTTATASNRIVFQKLGNGNNPRIIAMIGSGNMDGIVKITGTDYITFDKIDLSENSDNTTSASRMEWGYALLKSASKNGCSYVIIKNCIINLNKSNTNATYGIYAANHTILSTTELSVNDTNFCNTHNQFYSNDISNVFGGIFIKGPSGTANVDDRDNRIGDGGGNTISNYSGTGTTVEAGIYANNQRNLVVANNNLTSAMSTASSLYGIYTSGGTNFDIKIYNNTVTLYSGATGANASMTGIYNTTGGNGSTNFVKIWNNKIQNCKYSGTASIGFTGIYNGASALSVSISQNEVSYDTIGGTGTFAGISLTGGNYISLEENTICWNRKTGSNGNLYGIYFSVTNSFGDMHCWDNMIYNNSSAATSGSVQGYYSTYSSSANSKEEINRNTIYNLTNTGNGNVYGINATGSGSAAAIIKELDENLVYSLTSAAGNVYGIYSTGGTDFGIYKNNVYNLTSNSSTTYSNVSGIYTTSGTNVQIINNIISDLKAPSSTNNYAINAMVFSGGTNVYAAFNTIYLNAVSNSVTNFGSSALYANITPNVELKNNILVNVSTPGPTGGKTIAYRRSGTSLSTYASTSDNNCFYAGTPSSKKVIFSDGTNFDSTIKQFQTRVSGRDANSFTENPPFMNITLPPYNLHLANTFSTSCESGGISLTGWYSTMDDIDHDIRDSVFPDVGADEGDFMKLDKIPPRCSYTPIKNSAIISTKILTARIYDPSNVPSSGNGIPVLYWKKNANGSWNNVKSVYAGGYEFTFTFGSGTTTGDTVYYYIVAQDIAPSPNIGCYPKAGADNFTSSPPEVGIPPSTPEFYVLIPGFPGGNYRIGGTGSSASAGCAYVDLTAALADINKKEITGPINLILTKNYSSAEEDTFPLVVKEIMGQSAANTITIKPDTNVTAVIAKKSATAIFKFDAAKYCIIDGSNNGTSSRDLTITDSGTTSNIAAIWIGSQGAGKGSSNVTIKNCKISLGGNSNYNYGIFIGNSSGIGTIGADNDYITIKNNQIFKSNTGIYVLGAAEGSADSLTITNNIIGSDIAADKIGSTGIALYSYISSSEIVGNDIFGLSSTSTSLNGINIGNYNCCIKISKNKIHDLSSSGSSGGLYGIYIYGVNNSNIQIDNNQICNILGVANTNGIYSGPGNNYSFYYNSVYLSGDRDAIGASKPYTPSYAFYVASSSNGVKLKNNIFQNSQLAATNNPRSYAIYNAGSAGNFTSINYNDYYVSGAQGVLGYQGGNISTLADWVVANKGDTNSISADPFFNSPSNLQPGLGSTVLAAGTPVYGITTDIEGITRNSTNPSIGAYETGKDVTGPTINFTPFLNTSSTSPKTLTAIIKDPNGVPSSGPGLPMLYWKIRKAGAFASVSGVFAGSDQYNFSFGSGVSAGDTIFYYIVAQDNYNPVNVSVYPSAGASGYTINPPAVNIPPLNPSFYVILKAISAGNYDIGGTGTTPCATCTYVDLTAALADIATKEITGPISLSLTSDYKSKEEDAFPITINDLTGANATNTVTIKPAAGTNDTISANSATSVMRFNGADFIIIDGSNNGSSSKNLLIQNSSTTANSAAIQISSLGVKNGSTYNTIKNTVIMAGVSLTTTTTYGITATGDDNDNLTIVNNEIYRSKYGINIAGTNNSSSDNLLIRGNTISDTASINCIGQFGIYLSKCTNVEVSHNKIINIESKGTNPVGITFNDVNQSAINANLIDGVKYSGKSPITQGGKGIDITTSIQSSNISVTNNMISGMSGNGSNTVTSSIIGIRIQGINGSGSSINLYNNSVNLYGRISNPSATANITAALWIDVSCVLDIRNNIFSNSIRDTSGKNTSYAIYSKPPTTQFKNINFNNYYVSDSDGVLGYIVNKNDSTMEALRKSTYFDSNSMNIYPDFITEKNLHTTNAYLNSSADTIAAVTEDFDGDARISSNPDIGADEFGLLALATTLGADQILGSTATIHGKVNPMNEYNTSITFEYGTTNAYGYVVNASQSPLSGMADTSVDAYLTGLTPQTIYHYRLKVTTSAGNSYGLDSLFTTTVGIKEHTTGSEPIIYFSGDQLIIKNNPALQGGRIIIYDMYGKLLGDDILKGSNNSYKIDILSTAYYIVKIVSDNQIYNRIVFVK